MYIQNRKYKPRSMSLLLELSIHSEQLEETLDTIASLPFAIDPKIRAHGRQCFIGFPVAEAHHVDLVENALRGRGLRQARVGILDYCAAAGM